MEKHCLNCIWLIEKNKHCDFTFRHIYHKPYWLDDDNNFIDDVDLQAIKCQKYCERPPKRTKQVDLMEDYRNIVDKIKEHIKTELEKRYKDIKFDDVSNFHFLCFSIKDIVFDLLLLNNFIDIHYYDDFRCGDNKLETFEELFKYIDDVISEEA